jgi:hypothetical protein
MIFHQTAAPTGWIKQTALEDYGLRVTAGTVGVTAGTAFSTVFAQTSVGGHALTVAEMPAHFHSLTSRNGAVVLTSAGGVEAYASGGNSHQDLAGDLHMGSQGGNAVHTHSIQLALSYADVIIAAKS